MGAESWPLPWQQAQWAGLVESRANGQLPHALLLAGPSGTGKAGFAAHFAQLVLCACPGGQPCGQCRHCHLVAAGSHPDLVRVQPLESSKAIRIDQIRELREFCAGRPHQAGWRVILIEPAEALNNNAANALLKTLEEPGSDTLLMLVAHEPSRLPATVRSRCRSLRFPAPEPALALAWLRDRLPEADPEPLLRAAGGRPLRALALADPGAAAQVARLRELAIAVAAGSVAPAAAAAESARFDWMLAADTLTALLVEEVKTAVTAGKPPVPAQFDCFDALIDRRRVLAVSPNLNAELLWNGLWLEWRRAAAVAGG